MVRRGEKMKQQRVVRKVPRSAIARYMQVEANTLYRWESGWLDMPKYAEICYSSYFQLLDKQLSAKKLPHPA